MVILKAACSFRWAWILAILASTAALPAGEAKAHAPHVLLVSRDVDVLDRRMEAFMRVVYRRDPDSIAAFFPRTGDFSYLRTSHVDGREGTRTWRFPAADAFRAINYGGPLHPSFTINYHGQPIGLFLHQVMLRGTGWRRVPGNRFVPPGAPASSPTFVEWRREGGQWVISAFGDELFDRPFPSWCC